MRVGATWKRWQEGEALVFDVSFEHEVRALGQAIAPTPRAEYSRAARGSDPGDHPRAVIIVHFLHPQLMPAGSNGAEMGTRCLVDE